MKMYKRCLKLATKWHDGQTRRCGEPYINHPVRVADMFDDEFMKCVAVFHDVLEDTECTDVEIDEVSNFAVYKCVLNLVHYRGVSYCDYINNIIMFENLTGYPLTKIKIADIIDNLSSNPTERQKKKYFKALCQLSGGVK